MIILDHNNIVELLPMTAAIEVVDQAMRIVSQGGAELPLRFAVPVGGGNLMGVMPGSMADPACFGVKMVSLFPGNPAKGLSSHRGAIALFEAETGGAIAMMDASLLTAIRTAAASGVATRALARPDAERLTILGNGEQAEHHLDAMLAVRDFADVRIVGRTAERVDAFCQAARACHPDLEISGGTDVQAAVADADVICTVTAAKEPILQGDWIAPGTHLNIVGSSIPTMREVDDRTVERGAIWVDYLPSALAQAGEIVDTIAAGRFAADQIKGEIGAHLSGDAPGRATPQDITVYRSLGVAAQDLAAAHFAYREAIARGLGQAVSM